MIQSGGAFCSPVQRLDPSGTWVGGAPVPAGDFVPHRQDQRVAGPPAK
jgi:hypothetical protein